MYGWITNSSLFQNIELMYCIPFSYFLIIIWGEQFFPFLLLYFLMGKILINFCIYFTLFIFNEVEIFVL